MKTTLILVLDVIVSGCCDTVTQPPEIVHQSNTGISVADRQICTEFEELQSRSVPQLLPFIAPMPTGVQIYFDTAHVPVGFNALWGETMVVTDPADPHVGMIRIYGPQTFHYEDGTTTAVGTVGRLPGDSPDWCQWFVADDVTM